MEAFLTGFDSLMQPGVLLAIVIGSVGGLIIGAVPGIGPAIAIAILLPATVFLDDLVSLVLLLGVYGSSMYGGAIPAILINTPGTPVNALTTYDGYAMTRRGEASRALSLAYSASFFGGCFSIIMALVALFVFGPYLRDLGALFGLPRSLEPQVEARHQTDAVLAYLDQAIATHVSCSTCTHTVKHNARNRERSHTHAEQARQRTKTKKCNIGENA